MKKLFARAALNGGPIRITRGGYVRVTKTSGVTGKTTVLVDIPVTAEMEMTAGEAIVFEDEIDGLRVLAGGVVEAKT